VIEKLGFDFIEIKNLFLTLFTPKNIKKNTLKTSINPFLTSNQPLVNKKFRKLTE